MGAADYEDLVAAGREAIISTMASAGIGDIRADIEGETVTAPPQWQQKYGLQHGAAFGLSHGLAQLAPFRPAVKDARVGGLYFVGASTRPGNGVPLCMISAELAAERILGDHAP